MSGDDLYLDLPKPDRPLTPITHDAGGSKRWPLQKGVTGAAKYSPCSRYRYWLTRRWGLLDAPVIMWVGMNPSTAEAHIDDPTIRKEMKFSQREGFTSYVKVNVCDYRATYPKDLNRTDLVPCSDENIETIKRLAPHAARVVLAFGVMPASLQGYVRAVLKALDGCELSCLATTADGSPRHPLYVPEDARLRIWMPPCPTPAFE
jgi:hypothetical protein